MKDEYIKEERILEYLQGQMSEEERICFEKECESNPELKEEVEYYNEIAMAIYRKAEHQEHSMRQLLIETENNIQRRGRGIEILDYTPNTLPYNISALTGRDENQDPNDAIENDIRKNKKTSGGNFKVYEIILFVALIVLLAILIICK